MENKKMLQVIKENRYTLKGFNDRDHYLRSLADDYDTDINNVYAMADILGNDEDFDGLVACLNDIQYLGGI
jgi:hypothetical protein